MIFSSYLLSSNLILIFFFLSILRSLDARCCFWKRHSHNSEDVRKTISISQQMARFKGLYSITPGECIFLSSTQHRHFHTSCLVSCLRCQYIISNLMVDRMLIHAEKWDWMNFLANKWSIFWCPFTFLIYQFFIEEKKSSIFNAFCWNVKKSFEKHSDNVTNLIISKDQEMPYESF